MAADGVCFSEIKSEIFLRKQQEKSQLDIMPYFFPCKERKTFIVHCFITSTRVHMPKNNLVPALRYCSYAEKKCDSWMCDSIFISIESKQKSTFPGVWESERFLEGSEWKNRCTDMLIRFTCIGVCTGATAQRLCVM